jgi:small subunit ribosomal protein S9
MKQQETMADTNKYYFGLGRRKLSKASVRIYEGKGASTINGKTFEQFFPLIVDRTIVLLPLKALDLADKFYFTVKADGGGIKGIREAVKLGIARALIKFNPDFKKLLKDKGYLTRDDRMVERKHTGFVKARKKPQYSKR